MSILDQIKDGLTFGPIRRMHASFPKISKKDAEREMRAYGDAPNHKWNGSPYEPYKGPLPTDIQKRREIEIAQRRADRRFGNPNPAGAICHECLVQGWHWTGNGRGMCAALRDTV